MLGFSHVQVKWNLYFFSFLIVFIIYTFYLCCLLNCLFIYVFFISLFTFFFVVLFVHLFNNEYYFIFILFIHVCYVYFLLVRYIYCFIDQFICLLIHLVTCALYRDGWWNCYLSFYFLCVCFFISMWPFLVSPNERCECSDYCLHSLKSCHHIIVLPCFLLQRFSYMVFVTIFLTLLIYLSLYSFNYFPYTERGWWRFPCRNTFYILRLR